VKCENGKLRLSEQKSSLLELLQRAAAGSTAHRAVKGESGKLETEM
jgi:hypothetical protein